MRYDNGWWDGRSVTAAAPDKSTGEVVHEVARDSMLPLGGGAVEVRMYHPYPS
jgi:hypothetical protein